MPQNSTLRGGRIDHVSEDGRTTSTYTIGTRDRQLGEKAKHIGNAGIIAPLFSAPPLILSLLLLLSRNPPANNAPAAPMFVFSRQSIILKRVCGKLYRGSGRATRSAVGVANEEQSLATLGRAIGGAVF